MGVDGKVAPYGVYDLHANDAWVSVGLSHDTAEFAVATIRTWWQEMGVAKYPHATSLVITADGGGSNGYRVRLWKLELQGLVDELGFPVTRYWWLSFCDATRPAGEHFLGACVVEVTKAEVAVARQDVSDADDVRPTGAAGSLPSRSRSPTFRT